MATLTNNQQTRMGAGSYAYKVTGALELQIQLDGEGFSTITDGAFTAAGDGIVEFAPCDVKVINAGANTFTYKLISM